MKRERSDLRSPAYLLVGGGITAVNSHGVAGGEKNRVRLEVMGSGSQEEKVGTQNQSSLVRMRVGACGGGSTVFTLRGM